MRVDYSIDNMRVIVPSGRTAEKNPGRLLTVTGKFWNLIANPDAKAAKTEPLIRANDPLTIVSKYIEKAEVCTFDGEGNVTGFVPEFALDRAAGTLSLPAGERGRKAAESLSDSEVVDFLANLIAPAEADATGEAATS